MDHGRTSPIVESIAGLSAGTVSTLVVHPLDIVKTRMQIYRSDASSSASQPPTTVAVLRSLTARPSPVASLYRGLAPNLLGNATSWASFFFFKSRLLQGSSPADHFAASALAGCLTAALTNPVWVLKTRMLSSDRGSEGAYPSMVAGVRSILRTEGIAGFYRGLGVSLLGVSHGAVQFAVYEPAKRWYYRRRRRSDHRLPHADHDPHASSTAAATTTTTVMANEVTLVLSTVAKLVAGAVTYPYQVLRSRLQNYQADERFGRGLRGVVRRTWAEEGVVGFYRGLVPGVVRVMPATWVTFLVYENVRYHLPRRMEGGGGGRRDAADD